MEAMKKTVTLNMTRKINLFLFAVLCSVTLHSQNNNKESIVYLNGGGY